MNSKLPCLPCFFAGFVCGVLALGLVATIMVARDTTHEKVSPVTPEATPKPTANVLYKDSLGAQLVKVCEHIGGFHRRVVYVATKGDSIALQIRDPFHEECR